MAESPRRAAGGAAASSARGTTLLVTNLIKIAGLVIAVHEAFTTKDSVVIATGAFMMAGAQVSEGVLLALLERLLGGSSSSGTETSSKDGGTS